MIRAEQSEYAKKVYPSLLVCSLAALVTWIIWMLFWFYGEGSDSPYNHYNEIVVGIFFLLLLAMLVSGYFSLPEDGKPLGQSITMSYHDRLPYLSVVTIYMLLVIGAMCATTGGVGNSPFVHYLVAFASLSIMFAHETKSKVGIVTVAFVLYCINLTDFGLSEVLGVWAELFDVGCLAVALTCALVASLKEENLETG